MTLFHLCVARRSAFCFARCTRFIFILSRAIVFCALSLFRGDFNAGCSRRVAHSSSWLWSPRTRVSSAQPELDTSRRTLAKRLRKKISRAALFCKRRADAFADWCPEWIMTTVSCKKVINLWKRLIWLMKFADLNYWTWCCVKNRWSVRDPLSWIFLIYDYLLSHLQSFFGQAIHA